VTQLFTPIAPGYPNHGMKLAPVVPPASEVMQNPHFDLSPSRTRQEDQIFLLEVRTRCLSRQGRQGVRRASRDAPTRIQHQPRESRKTESTTQALSALLSLPEDCSIQCLKSWLRQTSDLTERVSQSTPILTICPFRPQLAEASQTCHPLGEMAVGSQLTLDVRARCANTASHAIDPARSTTSAHPASIFIRPVDVRGGWGDRGALHDAGG
jgi:hypothetical protein